jgi:two-component system sensor histidine kinase ChiS
MTSRAYERFVPQEFLNFLNKQNILEVKLGDQSSQEMAILFSDIKDFTSLSEKMSPEENFAFLNSYLGKMSPAVTANNGFIDKFIGDGIMALFPDGPDSAIQSAIEMQMSIREYNRDRIKKSFEPIKVGVGIHTGHMMLGTIGSEHRMESTVISDAVNLASRIERLTRVYNTSILISMQSLIALENPQKYNFRILDKVKVKGKHETTVVVEILDGQPDYAIELFQQTKTEFEIGVQHYILQEFSESKKFFKSVLTKNPGDYPALLYLQRAEYFEAHGVPPEWEGIYSYEN